jgi:lysophospholipase L1-like esterase
LPIRLNGLINRESLQWGDSVGLAEISAGDAIDFAGPLVEYGAFGSEDGIVQTQDKPQTAETPTVTAPTKATQPGRSIPFWASLSVALNGFLLLAVSLAYWKPELVGLGPQIPVVVETPAAVAPEPTPDRQSLPYEEWLSILGKEAKATAVKNPDRLTVMLGDSLTLWFPQELLTGNRTWLNQGISGENTSGLFKRLNLLNDLKPQTILIMVGVNDLIKGNTDESLITNYQKIVDQLKGQHPQAEIVMQAMLPHGGDRLTVDDREQVLQVSNERILQVNRKLRELATQREVKFLDLHSVFVDREGLLRSDLSTDGLHLNPQGYAAWQAAMQTFDQLALKQPITPAAAKPDEAKPDEAKPAAEAAIAEPTAPAEATAEAPQPDAEVKPEAAPAQ